MKVLILNGSPHANGNTSIAVNELVKTFESEGIETEVCQVGAMNIRGCMACNACAKLGKCVFDDEVNVLTDSLMSLMEPLLIIFLGGMVGFIVISLFMPLISLISKLSG